MTASLWLAFCSPKKVVVQEKLDAPFNCPNDSAICTDSYKWVIPKYLDYQGYFVKEIRMKSNKIRVESIGLQPNCIIENSILLLKDGNSNKDILSVSLDDQLLQLLQGESAYVELKANEIASIETTLLANREVLLYFGARRIGEQTNYLILVSIDAIIEMESF